MQRMLTSAEEEKEKTRSLERWCGGNEESCSLVTHSETVAAAASAGTYES